MIIFVKSVALVFVVNPAIFGELAVTSYEKNSPLLPSSFSAGLSCMQARVSIGISILFFTLENFKGPQWGRGVFYEISIARKVPDCGSFVWFSATAVSQIEFFFYVFHRNFI